MFEQWLGGRPSRAQQYVQHAMTDPPVADVAWLASVATGGDEDRAAWELRYLRRALALLVAQRDALDDRTGSQVAHALTEALAADRRVAAPMVQLVTRQFNERLSAYREMMALRGVPDGPTERVARTLLLLSGCTRLEESHVQRGAALVQEWLDAATAALRAAFGEARLPA